MKQKLCGVFLALAMVLSLFPVAAMADTGSTVELTQDKMQDFFNGASGYNIYEMTESASYKLTGDITIDEPILLSYNNMEDYDKKTINITIDLNGHILQNTSTSTPVLCVNYYRDWYTTKQNTRHSANVTIIDSAPNATHSNTEFADLNGGIIASNNNGMSSDEYDGGVVVTANGTLTMQGGTIINFNNSGRGVFVNRSGKFTMENGTITGCKIAGVYLKGDNGYSSPPTFIMNGGKITKNDQDGIYFGDKGSVTMTDGEISDNGRVGIEVIDDRTTFDMKGGSITGNKGGGVYVSGGTFKVSGNVNITGNTYNNEPYNVILTDPGYNGNKQQRIITLAGDLSSGAKIGVTLTNPPTGEDRTPFSNAYSKDYHDKVTSDNSNYQVYYNVDNKLELGPKDCNWSAVPIYSDDTYHIYSCTDEGCNKTKTEEHSSTGDNEATCQKKAVCDKCGHEYGALSTTNHGCINYTYESNENNQHRKVYSCSIGGYGDWEACLGNNATCITKDTCAVCGNTYLNPDKHEQSVSAQWITTNDQHYQRYECCGKLVNVGEHISTGSHVATCQNKATCDVCGVEYGSLDYSKHTGELDTTWVTDGISHWHEWFCCGAKADVTAHSSTEGNVATCVAKAVCDVCAAEYGNTNPENHTGTVDETAWHSDADGHWHEYTCCGVQADAADHVYDNSSDKDCNICGYVRNISNGGSSGGGSSVRKHAVSAKAATNGTVEISNTSVRKGTTVTLKVTPDAGYTLDKLRVLDSTDAEVAVEKLSDGRYSFQMPNSAVSVDASFKAEGETPDTTPSEDTTAQKKTMVLTIGQKEILVDGQKVANDVAPMIKADRAVLPIRVVAEELGADVAWKEAEKKITITKGDKVIELVIGKADAAVNGVAVQLDAPAFIENNRAYLPLRFVATQLGADVAWSHAAQQVTITYQK